MKYYMIAGEASGDLHGSNLIKELHKLDANANIRCWGGDLMQAAGATLVKHYKELAFMGFIEVLMNLRTILKNLAFCKKDIQQFKPDVLVLIDYPGFNLRITEWAKQQGFKVAFYISPQVWAWKESRVKKMKQTIDHMMVILPFEKNYYKNKWDWDVEYVGHPLVQVIEEFKEKVDSSEMNVNSIKDAAVINQLLTVNALTTHHSPLSVAQPLTKPIIALLPGSRKQEILKKLPVMLEVSKAFTQYQFVVAKAPGQDDAFYEALLQPYPNVAAVAGKTYYLLAQASAALVTSGTATLETALFGVPEVVCYKGSNISYQIAKRLIKVKYISLVNLIMDKLVVKELIQNELTVENATRELHSLLEDEERKAQLQKDYADLKAILSAGGNASAKAAHSVYTIAAA
ncbi:lipid-A-disaccharide synthase [Ilyomonas limi]|uniref:Lipid-A-disaccharide synthase n=1 Tax=Ilyomonas limi TaxID=2575867 RepID=A0A4U3KZY8_9BACT|nr:lipid-A-disaccharide synthase [Ilyomonas limi]TKK68238.1 lipid-A-disaccharide synthase [Ilyomonas limi]